MTARNSTFSASAPARCGLRHAVMGACVVLGGCSGRQSALDVAGEDAGAISTVFWVMLIGGCVLWVAMNGAFIYLQRIDTERKPERYARPLLIGGGIVLPVAVILPLLVWGLGILPAQRAPGDGLRIKVTGEQWWWRVEYWPEGAEVPVVSANDIRLPAGQRTEFVLTADKVIHSFWIPALGGKMDMFPARETVMSLRPTRIGEFRGQCAEFCGESHAWMAFSVVVLPPAEFDAWLTAEAADAAAPADEAGAALFIAEGCGACHAVRGTEAVGQVGPDLTHVGSRTSLGAGRLGTKAQDFARWIRQTGDLKPGVLMPSYRHLDDAQAAALARYLMGLK